MLLFEVRSRTAQTRLLTASSHRAALPAPYRASGLVRWHIASFRCKAVSRSLLGRSRHNELLSTRPSAEPAVLDALALGRRAFQCLICAVRRRFRVAGSVRK